MVSVIGSYSYIAHTIDETNKYGETFLGNYNVVTIIFHLLCYSW